jgi:DNA modification methylase
LTTASGLDPGNGKLAVTYRPLDGLIPYGKNARTHSAEQVAEIAASIRAFGWTNPILVDGDNGVIAGHGRLLAARKLGMSEVPVIELAGMSDTEKQAYIIADNKLALNAGWDRDLLALELGELDAVGFDLSLTGFGGDELAGLLNTGNPGLTDPDDVPEVPADPVTRPGNVWTMGRHRLVCGDATDPDDVALALAGVSPHLMITDPPYGVNYDPAWRESAGLTEGSVVAKGKVLNDDRADWREAWALFPGDVAYVWHGGLHAGTVARSLEAAGFVIRSQIIWDKTRLVIGRGDYHWAHEPAYYCVRKGRTGHWSGDRSQATVWAIPHRKNDTGHGTEKPVECMKRPIENNSSAGQAVYEPFSGSGTTIIAAEVTGRSCHAIELNPAYVDVAVRRWQDFTGESAVLETGDGRSFGEIAEERGARHEAASPAARPGPDTAEPAEGITATNSTPAISRPTARSPRTCSGKRPATAGRQSSPPSSG